MTPNFIISAFSQKSFNCGAIVLMKAALLEFGFNGVFRKTRKNKHWLITLRNKDVHAIADEDIRRLESRSRIVFNRALIKGHAGEIRRLKEYTSFCFAIMIRRVQLKGYNGNEYTETEAIKLLTAEGVDTRLLPDLLGLKKKGTGPHFLHNGYLKLFNRKKAVLLYSDRHIVVVSKGYYDNYGEAAKLNDKPPMLENKKARAWFELKH